MASRLWRRMHRRGANSLLTPIPSETRSCSNSIRDKIMFFDSHKLIAAIGHSGDRCLFTKHIKKEARSFNGTPLTTADAANFIRDKLANFIRDERAAVLNCRKRLNMLVTGYDKETGPSLYHIDCTASLCKVEKGAFDGDGGSYSLSMMDSHFHSGMSLEEAIDLVDKCIVEIRSSLDVESQQYVIKIVDENGARHYAWRKKVKDPTTPTT